MRKKMNPVSEVKLMDRMDWLQSFPDGFFDLFVDDPPYFEGPNKRGFYGKKHSSITKRVDYEKTSEWDVPGQDYFDLVKQKSKHQIIWGVNYYEVYLGPGRIVWDKCNADSSFSDCELAYCSLHDSVRMFRFMWNGMLQGKSADEGWIMQGNKKLNQKRIHPCEKPIPLYQWTFKQYAKPGFKIGSAHVGSGADRIAAYTAGFDFYGCEKSKAHFN